jgi:outer membrane protein assembly factor BamB
MIKNIKQPIDLQKPKNENMKYYKYILILAFITIALTLSACSGRVLTSTSWPGLTVDEDTAYLAYGQHVYAVNIDNGTEKWRYPVEPDIGVSFYTAPELTPDGQLIVGGYDGLLYSLNPTNGQLNWKYDGAEGRYIGSALSAEEYIYAPTADTSLYALDFTGNQIWSFGTDEALWAQPATDDKCECIYLSSMDHHLYAIDATTGRQLWKSDVSEGAIVGTPTYGEGGSLFIGTFGSEMVSLDAETGKIQWRTPTQDWIWSGPALDDNVLYFGDLTGYFYALDAATGNKIWSKEPTSTIVGTPLVIDDSIIYTTEEDAVYAVDKNGNPLWSQVVAGKIYAPPVAAGDKILITPIEGDSLMVALTLDGNPVWSYTPETE